MNVKLAFTPVSRNPVDLVAVVLDDEKTLHEIDDPQLAARERFIRVGSPSGELTLLKLPFNLSGFEPRADAVPALGAHTRGILGELNYDAATIDRLFEEGAVGGS